MGRTVKSHLRTTSTGKQYMVKDYERTNNNKAKGATTPTQKKSDFKPVINIEVAYKKAQSSSQSEEIDQIWKQYQHEDAILFLIARNPATNSETLTEMGEYAEDQRDHELGSVLAQHKNANQDLKNQFS